MNTPKDVYDDLFILLVGLIGLIPVGILALWAFADDGDNYERALQEEFAYCTTITDCKIPQQCRINAATIKQRYIEELDGSRSLAYKLSGYPTIPIGYPKGTEDQFLIPTCEP